MIPLYDGHSRDAQSTRPVEGHAGLWFERFFNQYSQNWSVEDTGKRDFLHSLLGHHGNEQRRSEGSSCVGYAPALQRQTERLASLAESLGGVTFARQSSWHFATGLGSPHPVENGLSWHPVLGTPYLPGSAVKGLARAWLELNDYPAEIRKQLFGSDDKDPLSAQSFAGEPELVAGRVIFFDALPLEPVSLTLDTMTPHMGKWYEQGAAQPGRAETVPADWHAPIPVPFLVARSIVLQFAVAPRSKADEPLVEVAKQALEAALANLGAGAKTAAGYGAFVELDEEQQRAQDKRRQERAREEAERAEQSALASLSESRRLLLELQQQAELPANQQAGSGANFHRQIGEALKAAKEWPKEDRLALANFARRFFKTYGSKNRQKEMKPLINELLVDE